jgi:hypothetical protein
MVTKLDRGHNPMQSSGARAVWFSVVARKIMDGGQNPPSIDSLCLTVPGEITTAFNDGSVTAAKVYGEDRRNDFRAGQQFFIREVLDILRAQGLVGGDDGGFTWLEPLDGTWQVDVDGAAYSIFGQEERRLSADRNMLGETDEEGITNIPVGMFMRGTTQPLEVQIIGAHGRVLKEVRKFQVHPLALMIPPMTERERESLRESIARDGVQVPLVIYQDKVLDGRHRFYFAVTLKKPVRIEEFEGTEEEAKRLVARLNLNRRHLTMTQQTLAAIALFGEEARKQTSEAAQKGRSQGGKSRSCSPVKMTGKHDKNRGPEFEEIVANKAQDVGMTGVTARAVKALKGIEHAPETKKRIDDGELGRPHDAKAAMDAERQQNKAPSASRERSRSVTTRTGDLQQDLLEIASNQEMPLGKMSATEIIQRLDGIPDLVRDAIRTLRYRVTE